MSYVECVQNCTHQTHMSHVKSRHQGLVLIINVELSLQTEVSFNIINTMLRFNAHVVNNTCNLNTVLSIRYLRNTILLTTVGSLQ